MVNKAAAFLVAFVATLAVILIPVHTVDVSSNQIGTISNDEANEYEYEVLSGIRLSNGNLQLTDEWHSSALDLVYAAREQNGWNPSTYKAPVSAYFVHIRRTPFSIAAVRWVPRTPTKSCPGYKADSVSVLEVESQSPGERVCRRVGG